MSKPHYELSLLQLYEKVFTQREEDLLKALVSYSYFIDPKVVKDCLVRFPDCVRTSNEYHPRKKKGERSVWRGKDVNVWDNTKARVAFGQYVGLSMGGAGRDVKVGWDVAHIFGMVHNPGCFTAGWNMALMPSFLRELTEEQTQTARFDRALKLVAYRLFFEEGGIQVPDGVSRPDPVGLEWVLEVEPLILPDRNV